MLAQQVTLDLSKTDETVYALAASPQVAEDGICFAACTSGIYRSQDGGVSWHGLRPAAEADESLAATALAVSPAFKQDRSLFAAVKGGILRSSDAGDTWFTAEFAAPPPLFSQLTISPDFLQDGMMLAGSMEDGVFSSDDRGVHWQPWNFGLFDLRVLSLALSPNLRDDETVFAGTETGLYRSTNGGRAWRVSGFPDDRAPVLCLACVTAEKSGELRVFVGTENHGLLQSSDLGESWQRIGQGVLGNTVNQLQAVRRSENAFDLFALVDDGIMRSVDAGRSWQYSMKTDALPTAMLMPDAAENAALVGVLGKGIMRLQC